MKQAYTETVTLCSAGMTPQVLPQEKLSAAVWNRSQGLTETLPVTEKTEGLSPSDCPNFPNGPNLTIRTDESI